MHFYNNPGKKFETKWQETVEKGKLTICISGYENVYERIQADLEQCKIENILKKVAMGDLTMLNQAEPMYVDATTMPKTLMEAQNLVIRMKDEFSKMPTEVKEKFNNSAEQYVSEMGTKEFFEKMAPYNQKIAEIEKAGSMKAYNKKVQEQAQFEKDVATAKGGTTE